MVPMLTRLPLASIRLVPAPAPELIPVVPLIVVPVIVLAVAIVPKPEAIEPTVRAPVPVIAVVTASVVSTRAVSLVSSRLNSVALTVAPFKIKLELELPVMVTAPVELPAEKLLPAVAASVVLPETVSPPVPWMSPAPAV